MRAAFSEMLVNLGKADPNILLLTGDHGYALFNDFRRECPGQYINVGIAEQNMIGVAAGLARSGFRPIVYGLSAFIPIVGVSSSSDESPPLPAITVNIVYISFFMFFFLYN